MEKRLFTRVTEPPEGSLVIHYYQSLISERRKVTCSLEHNRKPYDIAATITNVFISMVLLQVTAVETEITTSQCIKSVFNVCFDFWFFRRPK